MSRKSSASIPISSTPSSATTITSYGAIITVSAGPDDHRIAITDNGISELRDLLTSAAHPMNG
jgi:hypothetical protein